MRSPLLALQVHKIPSPVPRTEQSPACNGMNFVAELHEVHQLHAVAHPVPQLDTKLATALLYSERHVLLHSQHRTSVASLAFWDVLCFFFPEAAWSARRFTSYGRHFTLPPLLEQVNQLLLPFLVKGDTVVDFSCGYNVWLPMLKRMCIESGFVSAHPRVP